MVNFCYAVYKIYSLVLIPEKELTQGGTAQPKLQAIWLALEAERRVVGNSGLSKQLLSTKTPCRKGVLRLSWLW